MQESVDAAEKEDGDMGATAKRPPPERPQNVRLRTMVIASFWALILFVGLPMWWQTTSIHRAQLPLPEMIRWADGQVTL
jgi:GPI-anchor transamidase subunit S